MTLQVADRLNGIGEYYFSRKLREIEDLKKQGKEIISLGIGSPDLPPHAGVIEALQQEAAKPGNHAYQSYKGSPVMRNAISEFYNTWYGVTLDAENEILPMIGSKEGIMHLCMTYLNPGDRVFLPNPGYPTYRSAVSIAGGVCVDYDLKEENQWEPDFKAMEAAVADAEASGAAVKMMWVNYPHMPTGKQASIALFEKLVAFGKKHDILICHDNPYSFILNQKPLSILSVEGAKDVAVELNSLSKSSNMAGWRVGFLSGAKQRIDEVLRFKSNMDSGMFLPVQLAAARALQLGKSWYNELNAVYDHRRLLVYQLLDELGCTYDKSQAGLFIWARVPATYSDGYQLSDEVLYTKNIFITPGGIFGSNGNPYVRVSLCAKEAVIEKALERIKTPVTQ